MDLIAYPYHDWRKGDTESFRTRDGQLLRAFDRSQHIRQMLVIDRPVSMAERLARRTPSRARGSVVAQRRIAVGWSATQTRVGERTIVLDITTPDLVGPIRDSRRWWFDVFNKQQTFDGLDWAVESLIDGDAPIVAWTPSVVGAALHHPDRRLVFDSLDNWLTHPVLRRYAAQATDAYRRMLPTAAAVFVPSEASRLQLASFAPQARVLANGVDIDRFAAPEPRPSDLPGGPTVGYVGKLGVRLDVSLVQATAGALPDVAFVFVGPALEPDLIAPLRRVPNVHLLGDRRSEEVPAYLQAFDIAWIPHRIGEGETGGDLMKKYEYWAAGRQVVTTRVADLDEWVAQLHVVNSASEATTTIRGLLEGSVGMRPTVVPPDRSWSAIASVILAAAGAPSL